MTLNETRQKFLDFFRTKQHAIIASASLVPEDKTVLFVTAGMQPLVPYLMGEKKHPEGARLADAQKCLRTDDILEVGDNRHLTFFEMLGNWSLGDYFKKESIEWSFELLTSKDWFGIDPAKIYVSVFEGDTSLGVLQDDESIGYWKEAFARVGIDASVENGRIRMYPKKKNWWELPGTGPCGPDTEIFYDTHPNFPLENSSGQAGNPHDPKLHGPKCHVNCDCGRFVEIWNNVFMEYEKKEDGKGGYAYAPLAHKSVDTGMGLERIAMVLQGKETVFETDIFSSIITAVENKDIPYMHEERRYRIIADHLRAAVFLISDGILPSNVERGYILRNLVRCAVTHAKILKLPDDFYRAPIEVIHAYYRGQYQLLPMETIATAVADEHGAFARAFERGMKEFHALADAAQGTIKTIRGIDAFNLQQTYGFRLELMMDLAKDVGVAVDEAGFWEEYKKHQEVSRAGAEKKFGGHGMKLQTGELKAADDAELAKVTRLHTATHLLQGALREVLGPHVRQKGSDITAERLRFDFIHSQKMTDEEKKKVEDIVNRHIREALPVVHKEMPIDDAEKTGALMFNKEKYGNTVSVYTIGNEENTISSELCGGPHVENTKEIGKFKIIKEEASSAGVRRIRATIG
ncbi:alanine--tRNA ligase [Candidatus Azambacteria bacterium]|nr:alanine--tRNA ligase [Candidatus Azambacteria bacterium]